MANAPRIELVAPPEVRVRYLLATYGDIASNGEALARALEALPGRHGARRVALWLAMAKQGALAELARDLVEVHYDPAYEVSSRRETRPRLGMIAMNALNRSDQEAAAIEIARLIGEAS